jgi:hypothetical protein
VECHYDKGSRGGSAQLGGEGGEPMVGHVAAAWHWPARGSGNFSLTKVEDKPRPGRVTWWAEQARKEVGWVVWAGR